MFEFKKLCKQLEELSSAERGALLLDTSVSVVTGLHRLDLPYDPIETLVAFIIGSVVSDGVINEQNYLYIYPSLVKAFGNDYDFVSVKRLMQVSNDIRKEITRHTHELMEVIAKCDEQLAMDIVSLCLLITSIDGKISLREKRYVSVLIRKI